jgi:hypothetical protein
MAAPVTTLTTTKEKPVDHNPLLLNQISSSAQINLGKFPLTQNPRSTYSSSVTSVSRDPQNLGFKQENNLLDRAILFLECIISESCTLDPLVRPNLHRANR